MDEILVAKNILKVYSNGVVANKEVNFNLGRNEIHALIGENGAGKSTFMKMLFGMEKPDDGEIIYQGETVEITSSKHAIDLGIGMVHQHFMLVDSLTIAENIVLGDEPLKSNGLIDTKKMFEIADEYNKKYGFGIDINKKVKDVSVGVKQKTEILKALVRGAKVLILDEPTAVLTPQETVELFKQLRVLKKQGHSIIFISHKLNEIMDICDKVTIMRHGKTVGTMEIAETSVEDISRKMVGRDVVLKIPKTPMEKGRIKLSVENLSYKNELGSKELEDVSFNIHSGQILGVAGVEGNGQSTLTDVLIGLKTPYKGTYKIENTTVDNFDVDNIRGQGVSMIPEDRLTNGLSATSSILDNLYSNRIEEYTMKNKFFLDKEKMLEDAMQSIKEFEIVTDSPYRQVKMLSGGNMQKVVGARELLKSSTVIIANQPTRGIDAGAAELMRRKILALRDSGTAVLLVSSDLNEVLELSDSLMVMYDGKINAYFESTEELTEEELGYYMLGVKSQNPWY